MNDSGSNTRSATPSDSDEVSTDVGPWAIVPEWVILSGLSPLAIRVYALLGLHADRKTRQAFPGRARLAKMIEASESSVKRAMADLVTFGAIEKRPRFDAEGRQRSNLYVVRIVAPRGAVDEPLGGFTGDPGEGVTGEPQNQSQREPESEEPESEEPESSRGADNDPGAIEVSPDVERLANLLADLIQANGSNRPAISKTGFLDPIRLLVDKDGRSVEQVERAIRWSQADEFWRSVILSGRNLRAKYDQMRLQAQRQKTQGTAQNVNVAQDWAARRRAEAG